MDGMPAHMRHGVSMEDSLMNHVTDEASRLDAELRSVIEAILTQDPDGRLRIIEALEQASAAVVRRGIDLTRFAEPAPRLASGR